MTPLCILHVRRVVLARHVLTLEAQIIEAREQLAETDREIAARDGAAIPRPVVVAFRETA